ncbi:hypothetical protein Bbelb_306750 [Branchiostoma belcheri]|nr:hypothetical protein Bbelb_306750 [Branchiostoma belcheri]
MESATRQTSSPEQCQFGFKSSIDSYIKTVFHGGATRGHQAPDCRDIQEHLCSSVTYSRQVIDLRNWRHRRYDTGWEFAREKGPGRAILEVSERRILEVIEVNDILINEVVEDWEFAREKGPGRAIPEVSRRRILEVIEANDMLMNEVVEGQTREL